MSRHVLYVNTPTYLGGAEISLLTLMCNLDPERYIPVLVTSGEGQLAEAACGYGIETFMQKFPWLSRRKIWEYLYSSCRLLYTAKHTEAALIHTNCPGAVQQVRIVSRLMKLPYIAHVRDYRHAWSSPYSIRFLRGAACVVANSKAIARHFVGLGIPASKIRVVYNPVDIESYSNPTAPEEVARFRASSGIPPEALLIGVVGQVQRIKGQLDLVEAVPLILARFPEAHFLIVGAAFDAEAQAYEQELRARIRDLGLVEHCHLLGFRKDVPLVLQSLNIFVVPSWQEPFGRVVVEGMAVGCPVIGTNTGGIPEIIEPGVNGLLISPQTPPEIAAAVIVMAEDAELRNRLAAQGRVTAAKFSVSGHVKAIQMLYDTVLPSGRAS